MNNLEFLKIIKNFINGLIKEFKNTFKINDFNN